MRTHSMTFGIASLILSLCLLVTGCSDTKNPEPVDASSEESSGGQIDESLSVQEATSIDNLYSIGVFSEGLASIKYTDTGEDDTTWVGYINKDGEVEFRFDCNELGDIRGEQFDGGVAYLMIGRDEYNNEASCYTIDSDGTILGSFEHVVAHGGGYVVTTEKNEGFESSSVVYTIYDAEGNELHSISKDGTDGYGVRYLGGGIFGFGSYFFAASGDTRFYPEVFYLSVSNTDIPSGIDYSTYPDFDNHSDYALLGSVNIDDVLYVNLLSPDGEIKSVELGSYQDLGGSIKSVTLNDNVCTVRTIEKLFSYNLGTGEFHELPQNYFDAIDYHAVAPTFSNGRYVLSMMGADENPYIGIFDESWNLIVDPIKVDEDTVSVAQYTNDRLILMKSGASSGDVYDPSGELIFSVTSDSSITTTGTPLENGFTDDALFLIDKGAPVAYDIDGDILFDTISNLDAQVISE